MKEIIISKNEAGQRLDKLLAKYLREAPKSFLYKMLRKKNIELNGKKASGSEKLLVGDSVRLFLSEETISKFSGTNVTRYPADSSRLPVLYEDENIMLINKPAGMLSQKAEPDDISAVESIIGYLLQTGQITEEELKSFHPSVCNRLDRNTSGLLAAGKSLSGLQEMGMLFQNRTLRKYYSCLVDGVISWPCRIEGYLTKDEARNQVTVTNRPVSEESDRIETEYIPVKSSDGATLLEVHLITGKPHQIRAHLASVGHPVIGDYKYGSRKVNDLYQRSFGVKSQLLHAHRLEFPELTGTLKNLSGKQFIAPRPELFEQILDKKGLL